MRVCVINLPESQDRRTSIGAQLTALGVPHSFFDAIDARHGYDHFARCDEHAFLMNTGRRPSPHEVACYASHLILWRRCVALDEPLLILEDDAELLPVFPAALATTRGLMARYGFIRLQTYGAARHVRTTPVETAGAFTVLHCSSFPFGAMGYALTPRVARAFIAGSGTLAGPVDSFIKRFWEHRQPLFALAPGAVRGGPLSSRSTILYREKDRLVPAVRLRRLAAKFGDTISRARFNHAHRADLWAH
jgi:glycosyl transferase family 25